LCLWDLNREANQLLPELFLCIGVAEGLGDGASAYVECFSGVAVGSAFGVALAAGAGFGVAVVTASCCHQWCFLAGVAEGAGLAAGSTW
jgi:hypothetical protein